MASPIEHFEHCPDPLIGVCRCASGRNDILAIRNAISVIGEKTVATWEDVRNHMENNEPIPLIPEGAEMYPVVGLTFVEGYPGNVLSLRGKEGVPVYLVRNPENPYDSNAIQVRLGDEMLGHLAKEVAARLAPEMDNGAEWWATLYQVRVSPENPNNPGVDIVIEGLR